MPDSIRVKEIHASLGCGEWVSDTQNGSNPENFWYTIQRIRRVLGISIDPMDRSIRSIRQRAKVKAGQPIPVGWNFGQWGENQGDAYQKGTTPGTAPPGMRDGIAIEGIPNRLEPDPFNKGKFKIVGGDYILCENIPQLLAEILDQFDVALGLQESGAFALPTSNGRTTYSEGLHALIAEIAYTVSHISQNTVQTQVSSLVTQAIVKELLAANGLPIVTKVITVDTGDNVPSKAVYPGLAVDAPTLSKVMTWILQNLAILVGQTVKE